MRGSTSERRGAAFSLRPDEAGVTGVEAPSGTKGSARPWEVRRADVENRMPERRRGSRGRPEARGGSALRAPARSVTRKGTPRYVIGSSFL